MAGWLNKVATTVLFAVTAGAIIYTPIREELPDDSGKPWLFVLGAGIPALTVSVLV